VKSPPAPPDQETSTLCISKCVYKVSLFFLLPYPLAFLAEAYLPGHACEQILDSILDSKDTKYGHLAAEWDAEKRKELCQVWHKLDGSSLIPFRLSLWDEELTESCVCAAWEDVRPGLEALRQLDPPVLLATLSNGTLKLLVDLVRPPLSFSALRRAVLTTPEMLQLGTNRADTTPSISTLTFREIC
jgi:hypothetical protein